MALPRSTPSITDTFNRLSNPFSEQSALWLWDAEIPPESRSGDEQRTTTYETRSDRTHSDAPTQAWAGLSATGDTSLKYEPFGDPMQGWTWAPPSQINPTDAGLPPLVGAGPIPQWWQQPVQLDEATTESWQSFTNNADTVPKSNGIGNSTYQTPPDAPRFNVITAQGHQVRLSDRSYDSDSSTYSDVWSVGSSSDEEHSRTPDVPIDPASCQQQNYWQTAKPRCKPCTTARSSEATFEAARTGSQSAEQPQQPCPFCTHSGEDDEFVADGRKTRKRRRKAVSRTTQRHGRWWQTLGYGGPAYCQRCSEVFRDHIIREKPNSAECTRSNPCLECAKVLAHFSSGTGNHTKLWEVIDARGYAKVRRRSVAKASREPSAQAVAGRS